MDWKAHLLSALVIALLLSTLVLKLSMLECIQFSLFAGMAALIPDLDHDMGKARQILNRLIPLLVLFVVAMYVCSDSLICFFDFAHFKSIGILSLALIGLYFVLFTYLKPKHRGITHSLVACLALSLLIFFILNEKFAFAGFVGYASHLLLDKELKLY